MTIWTRIKSLFAWRVVDDGPGWIYKENTITGERAAIRKVGGCWSPLDSHWLDRTRPQFMRTPPPTKR